MPNISKSKGSQTMKFDQLIEYNVRNIFLEKSYINWGGKTSPRPFSKKLKLSISLDQQPKVLYSLFILYVQVKGYQNTLKPTCRPLAFTSCNAFAKNKGSPKLVSLPYYLHVFLKNISHVYSINWPNFIVWLPWLLEMLDNLCIVIVC